MARKRGFSDGSVHKTRGTNARTRPNVARGRGVTGDFAGREPLGKPKSAAVKSIFNTKGLYRGFTSGEGY